MPVSYIVVDWGVIAGPPQPQYLTASAYTSADGSAKKGSLTVPSPLLPMPSEYGWFDFGSSLTTTVVIPATAKPAFIDLYLPKLYSGAATPQLLLTTGTRPLLCMNGASLPKDDTGRYALKMVKNDTLRLSGTTAGFTYLRLGISGPIPDGLTVAFETACLQAVAVYSTGGSTPPIYPALDPVFGLSITTTVSKNVTTLSATVKPASTRQGVLWTSMSPAVATINAETGVISATQEGNVVFQAVTNASPEVSGTITLYVKPTPKKKKHDIVGMWVGIGLAIAVVVTAVVVITVYSVKHQKKKPASVRF